jgi:DNA-binding IclR family transcriptional regulator
MLFTGRIVDWLQVIRGEFDEAPDLRVTVEQAVELWNVDVSTVRTILETFVDVGFLRRSPDGVYSRRQEAVRI